MKKLRVINVLLIFVIWLSLVGFATPGNASVTSAIVLAAPASFNKVAPANGAANQPALGVTLSWTASEGATGYQYCVSPRPKCLGNNKKWQTAGTGTSVTVSGLSANTVYYWQIRALDASNNTVEANNGAWWRFKTQPGLGAFGKISPAINAVDQPVTSLDLKWGPSANATGYQYCLYTGTTNPCGTLNWVSVGNVTTVTVYNLHPDSIYHWQVRAVNGSTGTPLMADSGAFWQFTTVIALAGSFDKLSPGDTEVEQPLNIHLTWSASAGADSYEYCIALTPSCSTSGWTAVASGTDVIPFPTLNYDKTYYWQVRALNSQGEYTYANGGEGNWWSFSTIPAVPNGFSKISPMDAAVNRLVNPWLYWSESTGATGYELCWTRSIVTTCDQRWQPVGNVTAFQLTNLLNGATYYWQVRAVNGTGTVDANNGDMWHFTTMPAPPTSSNQSFSTDEDVTLDDQLTGTQTSLAALKFELYGQKPAGLLSVAQDGTFSYLPPANFSGTMTFQFTVTDGFNAPSGPYTATITVNPVNDPPVLTQLSSVSVLSGDDVSFTVTATDPDLPYGDVLTFLTPSNLAADATFDTASGTFIWNPLWSNTQSNVYAITFAVKDTAGLIDQQTVTVTVNPMQIMLPIAVR